MKLVHPHITPLAFTILVLIVVSPLEVRAQNGAVRARVTSPVDMKNLVTLRGNVHPLARAEFDRGVAPDDLSMERMLLVLQRAPEQEVTLRQLLDDQQVKSSPRFHQWLTPEQFGQQFGPADSDVQAVTDWLASQGFEVMQVAAGRTVIEFSGTAGLVREAFGTEIHKYRVNSEDHWANTSDPQIPAALAPVVAGFASLNNFPRNPMYHGLGTFRRNKATGDVQPLFTFPVTCSGGSGQCYYFALGPADFATIYNILPLWNASTPIDGTGQTIAIVGETNINPQDVTDFRSMFNLPANAPNIILNGPDPGILSMADEPEADLDVEWSGAVAKGATIDLVVSESTETTAGIDLSALYIIDNNLAPIMSESYGSCEAVLGTSGNQFYNTLWEQASAQGISVLLASGDAGWAGCDSANSGETVAQYGLGVSGLASTPFNVAVGGTDFNVNSSNALTYWSLTNTSPVGGPASAKSYIPETTWNDSCADSGTCNPPPSTTYLDDGYYLLAGGGGPSSCTNPAGTFPSVSCSGKNPKPSWQSGANVPNDGARDIPDISLFAGDGFHYTFYVMCEMDANAANGGSSGSCDLNSPYEDFQGGSGTSAAVQVFAGIMAMVNQRYGRQGNANYVLYPMAAASGATCNSSTPTSSCIFYDITVGNNSVICKGGSLNCSNPTSGSGEYGSIVSGGSAAYPAGTGYDLATGLGSVNVANLVNHWTSNFTTSSTTLSLSTSPVTNPVSLTHGQPINFNVNVTAGNVTPTGDVSLIAQTGSAVNNQTAIGPFTLSGGSASGSTIMLPGGSYNVTAHYAGNGTFAASDSTPGIPVTVSQESSKTEIRLVTFNPTTGVISYGNTTAAYGSPYVLRMDVTNSSGNLCAPLDSLGEQFAPSYPCPTGTLTVSPAPTDQNPPAGTIPGTYKLNTQGYAEDEPIQQLPGEYSFVASYAGDNSYTTSKSFPPLPIAVTQAPTTTTSCGTTSTMTVGQSFNCQVSVATNSNGAAPTGTVQMLGNGTPMGQLWPVSGTAYSPSSGTYAAAQVWVTETPLAGIWNITFRYSGDTNYAGSTSPLAATIDVGDFSLSANPSPVTISAPGQSGTSTVNVTSQYGYEGTVSLGIASGCPTGATCTLLSPTVTFPTTNVTVTDTLTVITTGSSTAPPSLQRRVPPSFYLPVSHLFLLAGSLALVMLLTLSAKRRRPAALLFMLTIVVAGVWVACGGSGGGGGGGTPTPAPVPAVTLSSTSLTFSSQNMGTSSVAQSVTLTDTGNAALSVTSVDITGTNSADFSQTSTCGSTVAAGANCSISVKFTPTAAGARSASLSITDDANGSPQTATLSGTGVSTPTPLGTYPIVLNAVSGAVSHSLTVNVVVQ